MDFGKFPKDRDGFNGPARQKARFLDTVDVPYLRTRLANGTEAVKKGDRLYTRGDQVQQDGFYSLGFVDGSFKIVGSATARGRFTPRGDAGSESFNVPALAFYGRGLGLVIGPNVPQGPLLNFDGKANSFDKATLYRTRNGRALFPHYDVTYASPYGNTGSISFGAGAWVTTGEGPRFMAHANYLAMQAGQQFPVFQMDWGDTQVIAPTVTLDDQLNTTSTILRLGPNRLAMFHRVLRPHYTPTGVDIAANPGIFLSLSSDGGQTWALAPTLGPMWDDFGSVYMNLPFGGSTNNEVYGPRFNDAVQSITVNAYPVSASRAVVIASVPYVETSGGAVKWRTRLGWMDSTTGAMTATNTLYDGTSAQDANAFFNASGVVLDDGVRIFCRPPSPTQWNEPRRVLRTVDGTAFDWLGYMPQPNYKTGLVTAISKATLICPMYDGNHSLFQSTDGAITWTKRAVIYAGAPAPDPADEDLNLARFAQVTFLRDGDRAASATPSAPWIHDCRIEPPV